METYRFENINYVYNGYTDNALTDVSFSVNQGEFIVVCGPSGSGKSTLLRCIKEKYPEFGFVMQNPSSQIVTDKVYHELAFGMENQGISPGKMRNAIAETATYFGIEDWLERDTFSLSGGEKQLVNLAAAIVMNPEVILLDEPTGQLDPMAAVEFMEIIKRLNAQMGVTVILVEQRLEEVLSACDRMLVLREGRVAAWDSVEQVFARICKTELSREYLSYMPSYVRLYDFLSEDKTGCPCDVKACRRWFYENQYDLVPFKRKLVEEEEVYSVNCKHVFFRYEKKQKDILRDICFQAVPGRIYGIVGGNGSGKSTFLKVLSGEEHCYHGKAECPGEIAYLPQEPKYMFMKDKIYDIIKDKDAIERFDIGGILDRHPYDVSSGQMQRTAMAYLYGKNSDIYLFDEPTKGLDPEWKKVFGNWLIELSEAGKTVIVVSHDVEFAANYCEYMSMCFAAALSEPIPTELFFQANHFYTTAIHRIVRDKYPEIVSERCLYEI